MIKLNVDAAVLKDHSRLAVIARDEYGKVITTWAKDYILCDSMMAKAFSILSAVDLTRIEMFQNIIFKKDAKVCFDALNNAYESVNWAIVGIISNISLSCSSFIFCFFSWVRKEANEAHSLTKYVSSPLIDIFCCNYSFYSSAVWDT